MSSNCVFCAHLSSLEVVYEDPLAAVVLHEDWVVPGHAMVVWKKHVENFAGLSDSEAAHFARVHRRAERALLDVSGADRAVLLKLGIITPHLHLHIYPVSAELDRSAVMDLINGKARIETNREAFVHALRGRLDFHQPDE